MNIIITEKAIAGRRIASILAGKDVPASQDTAQHFDFTKDGEDYVIIPLRGHIVDVDFPKQYSYWLGTDLKKLTVAEIDYVGKEKRIIAYLKKRAKDSNHVIVATDADREGEAIGVEALDYVKEQNPKIKVSRAYFSAITPQDINESFSHLTKVDYNMADSANARREIDLIWGAVLTRFLSLVSGQLGKDFLSVGRVQSPTLKLIIDREKERLAFKTQAYWELQALFEKDSKTFEAQHKKGKFWEKEEAQKILDKKTKECKVTDVKKTKRILKKPAPFNTTDFLRASIAIGFSAGGAMNTAESLYMKGYISYPRTDNTVYPKTLNLKNTLNEIGKVSEFNEHVTQILKQKEITASRGKKETTDHPPIYPVTAVAKTKLSAQEWKIYELVCRRFMATLADDAETENLVVEIMMKDEPFLAHGQIYIHKGWKEYYPYSKSVEVILPNLEKGDIVILKKLDLLSKETQPPSHYSQASIIKLMEDNNLGTKSTRHSIIQKLYARKYVSGQKAVVPNKIGFAVADSLDKHSQRVVDPKMTADIEEWMNEIAAGKNTKKEVVENSRERLLLILDELIAHKSEIGNDIRKALREDSIMGPCDKDGCTGDLIVRFGKTGKRFVGCSNYPKCNNSYPLPQKGKVLSLDKVCPECGKPMVKTMGTRYSFEMCVDNLCSSKDAWKKKTANKKKDTINSKKKDVINSK
ncbi:MAG: DNA topoisomerase I [Candidatus Diapherotrites archaeon]